MNIQDLKRRKQALKLTTAELSFLAGLPQSTVSKIMTGETTKPSYTTIERIDTAILREEMRRRVEAYSIALLEYIRNNPQADIDEKQFDQDYRKKHNLNNDPIPFAVPTDSPSNIGNLALNRRLPTAAEISGLLGEDKRIEILDSQLIINAAPSTSHQLLVQDLGKIIDRYITKNNGECLMFNVGINVYPDEDDDTLLIPDIAIICDRSKLTEEGIWGPPDWIIEVVSESTRHRDYNEKMHKYMSSGVREYWIVDPAKERVTVYIEGEPMMAYIYNISDNIPVTIYSGDLTVTIE